jgi:hypothetical protein
MVFNPIVKSNAFEKHENNKSIILKIFILYSGEGKQLIYLDTIIDYLRLLSQQNEILSVETMFNILDKEEKGYVNIEDLNALIDGLKDFFSSGSTITNITEKQERLERGLKRYFLKVSQIRKDQFERLYDKELLDLRDIITEAEEMVIRKGLDYSIEKKASSYQKLRNETVSNCSEYSNKNDSVIFNESKLEENKDTIQIKPKPENKYKKGVKPIIEGKLTKHYHGSPKLVNKMYIETQNVGSFPQPIIISEKNSHNELSEAQKEKEKKFVETISNLSPIKQSNIIINKDEDKLQFDKKNSMPYTRLNDNNTPSEMTFEDLIDIDKVCVIESLKISTSIIF